MYKLWTGPEIVIIIKHLNISKYYKIFKSVIIFFFQIQKLNYDESRVSESRLLKKSHEIMEIRDNMNRALGRRSPRIFNSTLKRRTHFRAFFD